MLLSLPLPQSPPLLPSASDSAAAAATPLPARPTTACPHQPTHHTTLFLLQGGQQHDSHEVLRLLLDGLQVRGQGWEEGGRGRGGGEGGRCFCRVNEERRGGAV